MRSIQHPEIQGVLSRRLEALEGIARVLSAPDALTVTLQRLVDLARQVTAGLECQIWFFDRRFEHIEEVRMEGPGSDPRHPSHLQVDGTFMKGDHQKAARQSRILKLDWADPAVEQVGYRLESRPGQVLCIPLSGRDEPMMDDSPSSHGSAELLGFLNVYGSDPQALEEGRETFEVIGTHIAQAVTNDHLRRIRDAQVSLGALSRKHVDCRSFSQAVVEDLLPSILDSAAASMFLANEADDRLTLAATTGFENKPESEYDDVAYLPQGGLTAWVWRTVRSVRVPASILEGSELALRYPDAPRPAYRYRERIGERTGRQLLAVPICVAGRSMGVLRMVGRRDNLRYTERDEAVALVLGREIGEIVAGLQAREKTARRLATFIRISRETQQCSTSQQVVSLTLAGITSGQGLGFNRGALWLIDRRTETLRLADVIGQIDGTAARQVWRECKDQDVEQVIRSAVGRPPAADRDCLPGLPPEADLRESGVPHPLAAALKEGPRLGERAPAPGSGGDAVPYFSVDHALVPITLGGVVLGIVYVDNAFTRSPITNQDLEDIRSFAQQSALVLGKLYEATRVQQLTALREQITEAVISGEGMAAGILTQLRTLLDAERLLLFFADHASGRVYLVGQTGFEPSLMWSKFSFMLGRTEPLTSRVVASGQPEFIPEARGSALLDQHWLQRLNLTGPLLAMPLRSGQTVRGVLVLNGPCVGARDHEHLAPLVTHLAMAAHSGALSRRFSTLEGVVNLLKNVLADFAGGLTGEERFLGQLAEDLAKLFDAQLCAIYRPAPIKQAVGQALRETRPRFGLHGSSGYDNLPDTRYPQTGPGKGLTNHVLAGVEVNDVPDIENDRRWDRTLKNRIEELHGAGRRAFMGVPLRSADNVHGAITLTRWRISPYDGNAFTEPDFELLKAIAKNVCAFFELQDARKQSRALHQVGTKLWTGTVEGGQLGGLLRETAEAVQRSLRADLVTIHRYDPQTYAFVQEAPTAAGTLLDPEGLASTRFSPLLGKLIHRDEPLYIHESAQEELLTHNQSGRTRFVEREKVQATVVIPLAEGSEKQGLMFVNYRYPHAFPRHEKEVIELLAGYAAMAIKSHRRVQEKIDQKNRAFINAAEEVVHSLQNTMVSLDGFLEYISTAATDEGQKRDCGKAKKQSSAARLALGQLADHANRLRKLSQLSASDLARRLVDQVNGHLRSSEVKAEIADGLPMVRVSVPALIYDFKNFVEDSRRMKPEGLQITVGCRRAESTEVAAAGLISDCVRVSYRDNGPGVAADRKQEIFQRRYGEQGRRTGIGLSKALQTARRHRGHIAEVGIPGEGVEFEILLPVVKKRIS